MVILNRTKAATFSAMPIAFVDAGILGIKNVSSFAMCLFLLPVSFLGRHVPHIVGMGSFKHMRQPNTQAVVAFMKQAVLRKGAILYKKGASMRKAGLSFNGHSPVAMSVFSTNPVPAGSF